MFSNRALLAAVAASFAILLAVVYVPLLQLSFRTVPLSVADWAIVCMFAFGSAWLVKLKSIFHLRTANIRPVR